MPEPVLRPLEREPGKPEVTIEIPESLGHENMVEQAPTVQPVEHHELPTVVPLPTPVPPEPVQPPLTKDVERVMAEGLEETYKSMDPTSQATFKQVGEATATTIVALLQQTKDQSKKILELLIAWLKIIPGINRFFLEQEAKIKTDKLLATRRQPPL